MTVQFSPFSQQTRRLLPSLLGRRYLLPAVLGFGLLLLPSLGEPGISAQTAAAAKPSPQSQKKSPQNPDEFPPNPLEITTPDPLLPHPPISRPLSPLEQRDLRLALDTLNTQAAAQLKQGDTIGAFNTWNRELRLRRVLGPLEEVTALGRVGDIAWKENQPNEVQIITGRLQAIQAPVLANRQSSGPERDLLLSALGNAYQQVRSPGLALAVYEQLLTEARQRKDNRQEVNILNTIGQLHLSWFDYPKAITTYQELLTIVRARGDRTSEAAYLTQLAYISEQAKQPEPAIGYLQQLVNLYQLLKDPTPIPALKIRIGKNYQLLDRLDEAEQSYKDVFMLAQPLAQFGYASDALKQLAMLYRTNNRLDSALRVYTYLVGVEQQAYNAYGIMEAYDQIGQIYLLKQDPPRALVAFQQGLNVSRQLGYRTEYFAKQIQQLQTQGNPAGSTPSTPTK